jgi:hypothetical protein
MMVAPRFAAIAAENPVSTTISRPSPRISQTKVIERHRSVMRISADEILQFQPRVMRAYLIA